jgi:UDP-glucuronate decarboxylase
LRGEDITIYGEGQQTRSFCYVSDLVYGLMRMMDSNNGFTGPVNLGNPAEFTILQLAQLVIEKTKAKSKLVYRPLPQDDPTQRQPNISLAKAKLNWDTTVPLAEGLDKTIDYFSSLLQGKK